MWREWAVARFRNSTRWVSKLLSTTECLIGRCRSRSTYHWTSAILGLPGMAHRQNRSFRAQRSPNRTILPDRPLGAPERVTLWKTHRPEGGRCDILSQLPDRFLSLYLLETTLIHWKSRPDFCVPVGNCSLCASLWADFCPRRRSSTFGTLSSVLYSCMGAKPGAFEMLF